MDLQLEGKWKETEYPFRLAHFDKGMVRFTEEGVVEAPRFRKYELSPTCPFAVNNIKNAGAGDLFLVIDEKKTCEIIKVWGDTLTLSGFNVVTNENYRIIYKKED